jgi:Flp pilus assembly pilin Flp
MTVALTATAFMRRLTGRFAKDRRGVSAVEFALLLPVMIALYLGSVEISTGVSMQRKVTLTAGAVANLTAQSTALVTSDLTNIMNASTAILAPYSASGLCRVDGEHPRSAGGSQLAAGFQRGELSLQADRRLHHRRHAYAVGQDVHDAAHLAADLQRHGLHLTSFRRPIALRRRSAAPSST